MSRAQDLRSQHDAEIAVAELEEELLRLKGLKRPDEAKLRQAKNDLRDARQRFRALRSGVPAADGDATVSPDTIQASTAVGEEG